MAEGHIPAVRIKRGEEIQEFLMKKIITIVDYGLGNILSAEQSFIKVIILGEIL